MKYNSHILRNRARVKLKTKKLKTYSTLTKISSKLFRKLISQSHSEGSIYHRLQKRKVIQGIREYQKWIMTSQWTLNNLIICLMNSTHVNSRISK